MKGTGNVAIARIVDHCAGQVTPTQGDASGVLTRNRAHSGILPLERFSFGSLADRVVGMGTLPFLLVFALVAAGWPAVAVADSPVAPGDGPDESGPRSRLTIRGEFTIESFSQQNFFLGGGGTHGVSTDDDGYWAQNLLLQPRFILSDNLNINLSVDVAQGVWGFDTPAAAGQINPYTTGNSLTAVQLDWAYLAYRHVPSSTRWYLGRQEFRVGKGLVLDTDASGIQIYRDFPGLSSAFGLGVAKIFEAGGFSDANNLIDEDGARAGTDGRDADVFLAEWAMEGSSVSLSPYFLMYMDRSGGDGSTVRPDGLAPTARFQPHVTRANAIGIEASLRAGVVALDVEFDSIKGVDRVANTEFGPGEIWDKNNGDLSGSNMYLRGAIETSRFEIGGIFAQGSGDDDPRSGEGNLNRIHTDGRFYITEVWEDSTVPPIGFHPEGLGSPLSRGYRELENTRIMQGFLAFHVRPNLRVFGSASLIRAVRDLRGFSDENGDGVLSDDEFGTDLTRELGSEFDWRVDWDHGDFETSLSGGLFLPRVGAGYVMYGRSDGVQEKAMEMKFSIRVPITEFSLGG